MYHQFNLNKQLSVRLAKRNLWIGGLFFWVIMFPVAFLPAIKSAKTAGVSLVPQILIYCSVVLFSCWSFFRKLKKIKSFINSYSLVIKDDFIVRRLEGQEELSIRFSDIKEIIQYKNGAFSVRSYSPALRIQIPHNIEKQAELSGILAGICPVKKAGYYTLDSKWSLPVVFLVVASIICGLTMENRLIVAIAGLILLAFYAMVICQIFIRRSVARSVRNKSWIFIVIFGFLLLNMLFKLMGYYTPR
jgi:tellurite resistance protein TehA-like permease